MGLACRGDLAVALAMTAGGLACCTMKEDCLTAGMRSPGAASCTDFGARLALLAESNCLLAALLAFKTLVSLLRRYL